MASLNTTVRTDLCFFTENRIYPGHGLKSITKDGKTLRLISKRCRKLIKRQVKPADLVWTQIWRRKHNKGKTSETTHKRRSRKVVYVKKAIVGLSLEDLKAKSLQKKKIKTVDPSSIQAAKKQSAKIKEAQQLKAKKAKTITSANNVTKMKNQNFSKGKTAGHR